jgi:four helix bundle protein
MRNFKELKVWEKSHKLTLMVYSATRKFPKEEIYGLTSQMRRSSASIPSNIAEGCGRQSVGDFLRFLQIAMGSASELEYQLLLSHDLGYLENDEMDALSEQTSEIKRMLTGFMHKLTPET